MLDSVSSGHVLHTIRIELAYWGPFYVDRAGLLTTLFATHIAEGIRRLTPYHKLRQLVFAFPENDPKYDESWWKEQICLRLGDDHPGPQCEILVKLDYKPSGTWSNIASFTHYHLNYRNVDLLPQG